MKESFGLNIAVLKQCSIHAERLLHCTTCDRSPLKEMSGVELLKVTYFSNQIIILLRFNVSQKRKKD